MNPGSGTIQWIVIPNGPAMDINFTQNAPAFKVGDSTSFTDGTSTITYDVTSSLQINSVFLLLQGDVENFGRILYGESASAGGVGLGSISGSILGASYQGGTNGAFTHVYELDFSHAVSAFSISQTLSEDINGQQLPSTSVALVGTVEQNYAATPEPATLTALGLGGFALIRRRKRRA